MKKLLSKRLLTCLLIITITLSMFSASGCEKDKDTSTVGNSINSSAGNPTKKPVSTTTPNTSVIPNHTTTAPQSTSPTITATNRPTPEPTAIPAQSMDFSDINRGGKITLGTYEQDNNLSNGKEKIEWTVLALEKEQALLVSKYCLDVIPYNSTQYDVTWKNSTLRNWLNNDFLKNAFSPEDQSYIKTSTVPTSVNYTTSISSGPETTDKLFLLSKEEIEQYSLTSRECQTTAYAETQGEKGITVSCSDGDCWWWTRTPGRSNSYTSFVDNHGEFSENRNSYDAIGVRPAMWINIYKKTPAYTPAVTADPAVYPDDYGTEAGPIRTDGKIIFWSESRAMYTIPEGFPKLETWSAVELSDAKNEQMVILIGRTIQTAQLYAIVKGKFYKLTEGNITRMSMDSLNQTYKWIEDNGIAKSLNLRSKNYNEVFIEAEGIVSWANANDDMYKTKDGKVINANTENILANVICYN